ncbi:MAG TPA: glycosyltransferase family 2 protein, partial [Actinomycetota bacterium]|nr:glycosyltransferase family 2 protein [Actinomycetota bacterium]
MTEPIALVFVTTNEGHVLIPALDSLFSSVGETPLEVVVVDNASTDGAGEQISRKWPNVRVITQDRPGGLPANLNRGIRETGSPYIMLCNSDLIFTPGAVETLARFMDEHPRCGIVGPLFNSPDGEPRVTARRWYTWPVLAALKGPWKPFTSRWAFVLHSFYDEWNRQEPLEVDWVPCPGTMFRRAALDEVGLMDERFRLYFDDVDIALRM